MNSQMQLNELFSQRLRHVREMRGYSIFELAGRVGCADITLENYERGSIPGGRYLHRLATVLNVSSDYLLGLSNRYNQAEGFTKTIRLESGATVTIELSKHPFDCPAEERIVAEKIIKQMDAYEQENVAQVSAAKGNTNEDRA